MIADGSALILAWRSRNAGRSRDGNAAIVLRLRIGLELEQRAEVGVDRLA